MKYRFSSDALAQLEEAVEFIRKDDPRAALRFVDRVEAAAERMLRFPRSGRRIPEFPRTP